MRNGLDKSCRENQNTNFIFSNVFRKSRSLEDNVEEYDKLQMTILRMRFTCWIAKDTDTNSEYVTLIAFSNATMVTRTRLSITFIYTFPVWLKITENKQFQAKLTKLTFLLASY